MKNLLTLLFLVFSVLSYSQEIRLLSLEECINIAVENNLNVRRSRLHLQSAEIDLKQAKWQQIPTLNASTSYGYSWDRGLNPVTNRFTNRQIRSQSLNAFAQVPIISGFQIRNSIHQSESEKNAAELDLKRAENDIIRISVGDTALIDVDSYSYMDKIFKGTVTQIANTANDKASPDAVTAFEVKIKILNSSYRDLIKDQTRRYPFRPGMTAGVDIITETRKEVVSLPLSAVTTRPKEGKKGKEDTFEDDKRPEVVFIHEEGRAVMKEIKTGISDFERIEIVAGIAEGVEVVSGPFLAVSKRLKDGAEIEFDEKKEKKNQPEEGI